MLYRASIWHIHAIAHVESIVQLVTQASMAHLTQDIAEIAHLLKLERFHRDTGQWEQCRAAFHPDNSKTHVDVAWFVLGLHYSSHQ